MKTIKLSQKELKFILTDLEHNFNPESFFLIRKQLIDKLKKELNK